MRYFEIEPAAAASAFQLPKTHPVFLRLAISLRRWRDFRWRFESSDDVRILWSGRFDDEWMTVYVAVPTNDIAERLADGWDGYP